MKVRLIAKRAKFKKPEKYWTGVGSGWVKDLRSLTTNALLDILDEMIKNWSIKN